jgi:predicted CoA-binding protein
LVGKGKAKKLALVAVTHKLLRQAYGVLKKTEDHLMKIFALDI